MVVSTFQTQHCNLARALSPQYVTFKRQQKKVENNSHDPESWSRITHMSAKKKKKQFYDTKSCKIVSYTITPVTNNPLKQATIFVPFSNV
jgi:hypothetical protein